MIFKEDEMFIRLYSHLEHKRGHDIVLPNFFLDDYECDMVKFHNDGTITEYEIKVTVEDFKKDFTKKRKGLFKHKELAKGNLQPNYFYFVVPKGMVEEKHIPKYAGLIDISKTGSIRVVKKAPILHVKQNKDPVKKYKELATKLSYREMTWRQKYNDLKKQKGA